MSKRFKILVLTLLLAVLALSLGASSVVAQEGNDSASPAPGHCIHAQGECTHPEGNCIHPEGDCLRGMESLPTPLCRIAPQS